jgi:hypothetical protein
MLHVWTALRRPLMLTPEVSMDIGRPQRIIEIEPASLPVPGPGEPLFPSEPLLEPAEEPAQPAPAEPVPAEPAHVEPSGTGG